MIIIIDPEVFTSLDDRCALSLIELYDRIKKGGSYGIALDKELSVQLNEIQRKIRNDKLSELAKEIVKQLLQGTGIFRIHNIDTVIANNQPTICELLEPESTLVRIAEALQIQQETSEEPKEREEIVILLAGPEAYLGKDKKSGNNKKSIRKLYDPPILQAFWANEINLNVRYANDLRIEYPIDPGSEFSIKTKLHARIFEFLVCEKLINDYPIEIVKISPEKIGLTKGDQIDFWGQLKNKPVFLYGEFKLRQEDNECLPLGSQKSDKIAEHTEKVNKIREFLGPENIVIPFFVSNAESVSKVFKSKMVRNGFHYFKASLSQHWMIQDNWRIVGLEMCDNLLGYPNEIPFFPLKRPTEEAT
jgi:hypothetical protein